MQTVFVVGSNSFSGASFVDYLLEQGIRVIGTSRSAESIPALLPYKWHDHSGFAFHQLDLNNDLPAITSLLKEAQPEYVVNFAAQSMVGESWQHPGDWFMTNAVSTIKFHDELRKLDFLKRYVHVSTPEVYGSCSGFVKEDFPFNPSTPYAVSRAAADMSLRTFHAAYDFPVVTTRAANVYGPGQQLYRIIPRTILFIMLGRKLQLHGGGSSTRSFIHMRDVSEATWRIALDGRNGDTYHISTDSVISIRDLVAKICTRLEVDFDKHVEVVGERLGKDSAYHLDSTKLREELGWRDQITLDQGIDACVTWVKQNFDALKDHPFDYLHKP
ncbi:MAG: dTDP-glucose 4,6-dehydratase [Rhodocyclales bacterium]|nr:dTDP-glucose 4,6-dehydratase [Rhodocyclales bacterium]